MDLKRKVYRYLVSISWDALCYFYSYQTIIIKKKIRKFKFNDEITNQDVPNDSEMSNSITDEMRSIHSLLKYNNMEYRYVYCISTGIWLFAHSIDLAVLRKASARGLLYVTYNVHVKGIGIGIHRNIRFRYLMYRRQLPLKLFVRGWRPSNTFEKSFLIAHLYNI